MAETEIVVDPEPSREEEITNGNEDHTTNVQKPSDGSDSESESDSDSDDETQAKAQTEALELELYNNPSNYDAYVKYIKILRKQGDIDKLRQAREAMSALYPLSPDMWREWAKDETTMCSGADAFPAVEKLYEQGLSDYLSVPLWCDYLNFVQEYDPLVRECSAVGISKARNLFERAITAAGLHVAEGGRIWELYREFEQAILLTIEETDSEARERQIQRIRNLFHRQLSVPLVDLTSTLLTYKAWEADQGVTVDVTSSKCDGLPSHFVSAYQKALEMLNDRAPFEEKITKKDVDDSKKLQEFMTYLKFEQSSGDPARVNILYERAITEFPISSDLWLDYTRYLDKTFKTSRIVRDVYYRATRNCPWIGDLWVCYLLCLERCHASEEELSSVFEKSLLCTFSSFDEYLNVFLTRVDELRRRISASTQVENGMEYAVIRDIFQRASDYLSPHLKNTDSFLRMHSYWARLESKLGKDLISARGVWESLLKISGSMLEAWQGYIAMEIEMGHINEARSLYKRCYSRRFPGTGSEEICHSWVRFEREYGSLEDFDFAVQKVTPRLQELQLFKLQQESKSIGTATDERENLVRKNVREKRKQVSSSKDEQPPAKRRKDLDQKNKKVYGNDRGQGRHLAEAGEVAQVHDSKADMAGTKETKNHSPRKPVIYNDQCTAFISNISLQATDKDLLSFFSDVGGVVDIRILTDKVTKKPRGLAYVDFSDDAHLAAAVEKNRQSLLGKRLSIARSDPQQGRGKKTVGHSTKFDRGEMDSEVSVETSKGRRGPQPQSASHRRGDDVQLKGKNTFAVPRNVRALGFPSRNKAQSEEAKEVGDEDPKSNDEFRKMFLKG
ncbi:embryo defective [Forsythia ovata]|uniref:Embryo defective n=1 Tax=Forsythia ovata TaxID=205694 RepID=A0ABD1QQ55_9LAMI